MQAPLLRMEPALQVVTVILVQLLIDVDPAGLIWLVGQGEHTAPLA